MRLESIELRKQSHRRGAVTGAVFFVCLQIVCAVSFASLCLIPGLPGWAGVLFGALAVFCLALIIPIRTLLKQRFEEIEGGELDEAGKY